MDFLRDALVVVDSSFFFVFEVRYSGGMEGITEDFLSGKDAVLVLLDVRDLVRRVAPIECRFFARDRMSAPASDPLVPDDGGRGAVLDGSP